MSRVPRIQLELPDILVLWIQSGEDLDWLEIL